MKEYTFNVTAREAVNVANICHVMKGDGKMKLLRHKLVKAIADVWPEFSPDSTEEDFDERPELNEKRELIIKSKWLRAFATGLVDMINEADRTVLDVSNILLNARIMRVRHWVEKQIPINEVDDFNDPLDGEEPLVDEPEQEKKAA